MMTSFAIRPKMAKVRFPGRGSRQRPLLSDSEIIDSLHFGEFSRDILTSSNFFVVSNESYVQRLELQSKVGFYSN